MPIDPIDPPIQEPLAEEILLDRIYSEELVHIETTPDDALWLIEQQKTFAKQIAREPDTMHMLPR